MPIKTIIFDLGKVIVDYSDQRLYENLAKSTKLEWRGVKERFEGSGITKEFDLGKFGGRNFWRKLSNLVGMEISYEEFKQVWSSRFFHNREMEKLVQNLKANYELLLLSNTNKLHYKWIEKNYPVLESFDDHILSFEVGKRKPNPEIFEIVLKKIGSRPKECVYTDDIRKYVKVAEDLGMKGVWFKGVKNFKEELKNLQVEWRAH